MNIKSVVPRMLKVNVPEVATKLLKLRKANNKNHDVVIELVTLFGFHGDAQVVEEMIAPGKGYRIRLATDTDTNTKKVYMREYKSRSANPLKADAKRVEQLVETAGQKIINESMGDATHAHITFRYGELTFVPVSNAEYKLVQDLSIDDKINTLVAMTGGVDCSVLEQAASNINVICEFRPQKKGMLPITLK